MVKDGFNLQLVLQISLNTKYQMPTACSQIPIIIPVVKKINREGESMKKAIRASASL